MTQDKFDIGEPRFRDVLTDPVIKMVMYHDGVEESELRRLRRLPQSPKAKRWSLARETV